METPWLITEKAYDLFLKYGVRSVTMDDIAAELSIGKNTIYKFFESKDALVENFIEKAIQDNEEICRTFLGRSNDPVIELFFIMLYAQRLYLILNQAILLELKRNYHKAYLAVKQYKDGFIFQAIKASIGRGIELQLYQDDFDLETMSRFFLESLLLISDNTIFSATNYNTTSLSEEIFGHLISGIATSAGTDLVNHYKNQHRFTRGTQTLKQPFWED
jgi:AcrR family transcriptional regulator